MQTRTRSRTAPKRMLDAVGLVRDKYIRLRLKNKRYYGYQSI